MSFAAAYSAKKHKGAKMADCMSEGEDMHDADMIARIMQKRKEYSQGGMVANDVGVAEADKLPAEYDDLVLRDDLEFSYDGKNSGDELGDDVVSKVMKKRKG